MYLNPNIWAMYFLITLIANFAAGSIKFISRSWGMYAVNKFSAVTHECSVTVTSRRSSQDFNAISSKAILSRVFNSK